MENGWFVDDLQFTYQILSHFHSYDRLPEDAKWDDPPSGFEPHRDPTAEDRTLCRHLRNGSAAADFIVSICFFHEESPSHHGCQY